MLSRSMSMHNLRYTSYIADGDTKNDISINQAKPYGDCANIKKKYGRTYLDGNKTLDGKGRLGMFFRNNEKFGGK